MQDEERSPLVLVVEDDSEWQATLAGLLEPLKVRVGVVGTVMDALRFAEQHPPDSDDPIDLVILDMRLPDGTDDGGVDPAGGNRFLNLDAYGFLRRGVPVIVFTSYESYDDCIRAVRAGAHYYLPKMVSERNTSEELLELCRRLLFPQEVATVPGHGQPDWQWFERHHNDVRARFGGGYAAFIPANIKRGPATRDGCDEIDGVRILAAETFEQLRRKIVDDPEVRALMPPIVKIESEGRRPKEDSPR